MDGWKRGWINGWMDWWMDSLLDQYDVLNPSGTSIEQNISIMVCSEEKEDNPRVGRIGWEEFGVQI